MANRLRNIAKYTYYAFRELDPSAAVRIRWQIMRNRSNSDAIFIHIPKTAGMSFHQFINVIICVDIRVIRFRCPLVRGHSFEGTDRDVIDCDPGF